MDLNMPIEAIEPYFDYLMTTKYLNILVIVIAIFFAIGSFRMLINLDKKRKTKEYREDLTNLYVAGKIKQIAEKDGVEVEKEIKEFRKFEKVMNCKYKELDSVLEEEMKEKIQKDFEEAKEKPKK